jgi:hypothetical protein
MDESKHPIPPNEQYLRPASGWTSAVGDSPAADLAKSDGLVALERQRHSNQIKPCTTELPSVASVVVFWGNDQEVNEGSLIALDAMGVSVIEEPDAPTRLPGARARS